MSCMRPHRFVGFWSSAAAPEKVPYAPASPFLTSSVPRPWRRTSTASGLPLALALMLLAAIPKNRWTPAVGDPTVSSEVMAGSTGTHFHPLYGVMSLPTIKRIPPAEYVSIAGGAACHTQHRKTSSAASAWSEPESYIKPPRPGDAPPNVLETQCVP